METSNSLSRPASPSTMSRKWARKCERYCCLGITYFPLLFVYSITTWAVWVETSIGFAPSKSSWIGANLFLNAVHETNALIRYNDIDHRRCIIYYAELVVHNRSLHESRIDDRNQRRIQFFTDCCAARCDFVHRQVYRRATVLQEMSGPQAGSSSSLFDLSKMRS